MVVSNTPYRGGLPVPVPSSESKVVSPPRGAGLPAASAHDSMLTPHGPSDTATQGKSRSPERRRAAMMRQSRRAGQSASDAYLTQITDDLLVEKRSRKAEREQYEAAVRRLEEKIMQMDDTSLRADTESEKAMHLRQRLEQLQEQYDFRKAEIIRLQSELRSLQATRDREKGDGHQQQQEANLTIEGLSQQVCTLQASLENALRESVATKVMEDTQHALALEQLLDDFFGLTLCDIPSLEVDAASQRLSADPEYEGCFAGCVGVVLVDDHLGTHLTPGDTLLRVDDIEIASAQHLQLMLAAMCRPDVLLQFRRGSVVRSVRVKPKKTPLPCHIADVSRICRLTGGLTSLLADYKSHITNLNEQNDRLKAEHVALEDQAESLRQTTIDLKRLADAAKEPPQLSDRTMDMQLVGTNAKLAQEKKVMTLRLSRAVEDKARLEEDVQRMRKTIELLQQQRQGEEAGRLGAEEALAAATRELDAVRERHSCELDAVRAELCQGFDEQKAGLQQELEEAVGFAREKQQLLTRRLAELEAELEALKERDRQRTVVKEEWARPSDIGFEKVDAPPTPPPPRQPTPQPQFTPAPTPQAPPTPMPLSVPPVSAPRSLLPAAQPLMGHTWESNIALAPVSRAAVPPPDVQGVLGQLEAMLGGSVAMLPGFGPIEQVMSAIDACNSRIPRLEAQVQGVVERLRMRAQLQMHQAQQAQQQQVRTPPAHPAAGEHLALQHQHADQQRQLADQQMQLADQQAQLEGQRQHSAELESECAVLRSAADDLMRRLEEAHKCSEALRHAEVELKESSSMIATLQAHIASVEAQLEEYRDAAAQPQVPVSVPVVPVSEPRAFLSEPPVPHDDALQSPPRPLQHYAPPPPPPVPMPQPVVYSHVQCDPPESFQEVEIIEHHTKIFVDEGVAQGRCPSPCAGMLQSTTPSQLLRLDSQPINGYPSLQSDTPVHRRTLQAATGGTYRSGSTSGYLKRPPPGRGSSRQGVHFSTSYQSVSSTSCGQMHRF